MYFAFTIITITLIFAGKLIRRTLISIFETFWGLIKFTITGIGKFFVWFVFYTKMRCLLFSRKFQRSVKKQVRRASQARLSFLGSGKSDILPVSNV